MNLLNGDEAGAVGSYGVVAIEAPDNGEAAFFVAYADYVSVRSNVSKGAGSLSDVKNALNKMEDCFKPALESVSKSEEKQEEKLAIIRKIVDIYIPLPGQVTAIKTEVKEKVKILYKFASYIEKEFNYDKEAMKISIDPLKEAVKLQQKFYIEECEGIKVVDTAERIRKVDPSYTMPKKAGCISFR